MACPAAEHSALPDCRQLKPLLPGGAGSAAGPQSAVGEPRLGRLSHAAPASSVCPTCAAADDNLHHGHPNAWQQPDRRHCGPDASCSAGGQTHCLFPQAVWVAVPLHIIDSIACETDCTSYLTSKVLWACAERATAAVEPRPGRHYLRGQ